MPELSEDIILPEWEDDDVDDYDPDCQEACCNPEARTYRPLVIEEALPIPDYLAAAPEALELLHLTPSDTGYGTHLRASFQFFRRHAQNRYSASTLMRLANAAGEFDDRTRQGTEQSPRTSTLLPVITVAHKPTSYDEDTEVKSGGTVGMMITWPDGKALFAVTGGARRQGIGRRIFIRNSNYSMVQPYFWVGTTNIPAQQFLLSMGLTVTGLNGNGAVRYGTSGGEE